MSTWPIRLRLTLWYAASLAILLTLFGVLIDRLMYTRLIARTDDELAEEIAELSLEVQLSHNDAELANAIPVRFSDHPLYHFAVLNGRGEPVFLSNELHRIDVSRFRVATPAIHSAEIHGLGPVRIFGEHVPTARGPISISVVSSLHRGLAELHELRLLLLTVGPLVPVVSLLGGYLLAGRMLRPLGSILSSAERITATHLAERIAVSNPYDEIGRLTLTLNRMLDRVQQSVEEQSQFTADAAHELRTPLAVIRSSVEQTLSRPRTSDRYVTCLRTVVEEANRVSQLSNQLLLLSRERIAETEKNFIPMNLRLLLLDIVEDFEPLCELHGQFLKVELPVDLPVLGDARRLRSVFLNLLDNAVKFTPGGGSIELRATSGENVEVVVADSGIGIPEKDLPHLFQRFYRVERSRNRDFGGAGLGLAICQAIVQNHRGTISICSRWTQGTQVRISFPRRVEEPEIAAIRDFAARTPESANAD